MDAIQKLTEQLRAFNNQVNDYIQKNPNTLTPDEVRIIRLEKANQMCNASKVIIDLLDPSVSASPNLTLQQFLLEELIKLENWPDKEFRKNALSIILQADREDYVPLEAYRRLNPFHPTSQQFRIYNFIFMIASKSDIITIPLGTVRASDRSGLDWEQKKLDLATRQRIGGLYEQLFDLIMSEFTCSTRELHNICSNINVKGLDFLKNSSKASFKKSDINSVMGSEEKEIIEVKQDQTSEIDDRIAVIAESRRLIKDISGGGNREQKETLKNFEYFLSFVQKATISNLTTHSQKTINVDVIQELFEKSMALLLHPEELLSNINKRNQMVQNCYDRVNSKFSSLTDKDKICPELIGHLVNEMNRYSKALDVHFSLISKHSMMPSITGLLIHNLSKSDSHKEIINILKNPSDMTEIIENVFGGIKLQIDEIGFGITLKHDYIKHIKEWIPRAVDTDELFENLPLVTINTKKLDKLLLSRLFRVSTSTINHMTRGAPKRRNVGLISFDKKLIRSYNEYLESLWREAARKKRLLKITLESFQRHLSEFASTMEESDNTIIPSWIIELDRMNLRPKKTKVRSPSLPTCSSSVDFRYNTNDEEEISSSPEVALQITPLDTNDNNQPQDIFVEMLKWDVIENSEDTFHRLRIFPRISSLIEAKLVQKSTKSLEGLLLKESSHHLFFLNQGMQLLFTALLHEDWTGVLMALPNLILDHHTFVECHLKSQLAIAKNELSKHHSLSQLGEQTNQSSEVFPYLNAFNQGAIWERYLYTSKALNDYHNSENPKAIQIMESLLEGKFDKESIILFAITSYLDLIDYCKNNQLIDSVMLEEGLEALFAKLKPWVLDPVKASSSDGHLSDINPIVLQKMNALASIINAKKLENYSEHSPFFPAKEVYAHHIRLDAAKTSASRYRAPELTAYHARGIRTAHYLFEQSYRARTLALKKGSDLSDRHGFKERQMALDPEKTELNIKTNRFLCGIQRRYPEYFKYKHFLNQIMTSRDLVQIEPGFSTKRIEKYLQKLSLNTSFEVCQSVALEHLNLLILDISNFQA